MLDNLLQGCRSEQTAKPYKHDGSEVKPPPLDAEHIPLVGDIPEYPFSTGFLQRQPKRVCDAFAAHLISVDAAVEKRLKSRRAKKPSGLEKERQSRQVDYLTRLRREQTDSAVEKNLKQLERFNGAYNEEEVNLSHTCSRLASLHCLSVLKTD